MGTSPTEPVGDLLASPAAPKPGSRIALFTSLGATAILFAVGFLFLKPYFQTTDDPLMILVLKGIGVTDHPTEFIFFINVQVGMLLKNLYSWIPGCPWYGLFLFSVFFLSTWAFLWVVWAEVKTTFLLVLMGLVFLPVFFDYYAWPQYTITAFWAAQAGLLLLTFSPPPHKAARTLSGTLIFLSSLVRFNSTLLTLVVFLPLWIYRHHQRPGQLKSQMIFLFRISLLVFSAHLFDTLDYRLHPSWQQARQYDADHNRLVEYKVPDYGKNQEIFQSFGWSPNDLGLFKSWMWLVPKFDGLTLQKLSRQTRYDWPSKLKFWKEQHLDQYLLAVQLLISLLWFAASLRYRSAPRWILLNTAVIGSAMLLILLLMKLPPRVLYPQIFYWSLSNALLVASQQGWDTSLPRMKNSDPWGRALLLGLSLGFCLLTPKDFYANRRLQEQERLFSRYLDQIPLQKNQLMVVWGSQLPIQDLSAFSDFQVLGKFRIAYLTWLQRSPLTQETLDQFHINDLLRDMVDRKDIFVIFDPKLPYWQPYLRQTYGLSADARQVYPGLYQIISKSAS